MSECDYLEKQPEKDSDEALRGVGKGGATEVRSVSRRLWAAGNTELIGHVHVDSLCGQVRVGG